MDLWPVHCNGGGNFKKQIAVLPENSLNKRLSAGGTMSPADGAWVCLYHYLPASAPVPTPRKGVLDGGHSSLKRISIGLDDPVCFLFCDL